jgi:hypothetical protein
MFVEILMNDEFKYLEEVLGAQGGQVGWLQSP